MNEIKAADVNTGYGAKGVPAFTCRFEEKSSMKWQKLAIQGGNNQKRSKHEKSQRMKPM